MPRPSHYSEYGIGAVPEDDPFGQFMSHIVLSTVASHRESYRSAVYHEPPQLEIIGVRLVVNPRVQASYMAKLENLEGKRQRKRMWSPISALSHLKVPTNIYDFDLNEHFLFHGAVPSTLEKICKGGFNPQMGGETSGKLFGTASYFAANSSNSDDYTEDRANQLEKNAKRTLMVARVALGESFRASEPMQQITRPPDDDEGVVFDSIWADTSRHGGCVDHLEVMVFSEAQALPVALVDYRHAVGCTCAFCWRRP
ncbi:unnamed protein product [Prorocentrum cordatum]|uniref:PARP catalytic domain-containing protein n=1 Tax=Prorocentrum cordatum TaxID=2364126 RepID=A0ABN9YFS6_9DINO|nr:unnamed protein product [Polarella glacialis]